VTLVVETGYGVVGAESYASVNDADAWWAGRTGPDAAAWLAATGPQKETALREASTFIDINYMSNSSLPYVDGQGLLWPYEETDYTLAALQTLRRAVIMIAPLALETPLIAQTPASAAVVSESVKVGDLSESKTYATSEATAPTVVAGRDLSFLGRMLVGFGSGGVVIGRRVLG